ncbi:hypothetical protein QAD02_004830 [Eretmocerus hayati]|uniref:Uncharacterized protein n=1 Tax=Eretmocerus hayati TaxID=131215 RepID=A0ACC2NQX1_9HYME|nr:hypothetical protein QAD02_004830 [Eretmocerus hayati]
MANIESKLIEQHNKISTIGAKVDRLGSDNKATNDDLEQCKSDIMEIHDAVDAIKNKVATLDTEAICAEVNDRARRQNKVIMYNVKEPLNENCFNSVSNVLSKIKELKNPVFTCKRIGTFSADKSRPILVTFSSFSDALPVHNVRETALIGVSCGTLSERICEFRYPGSNRGYQNPWYRYFQKRK